MVKGDASLIHANPMLVFSLLLAESEAHFYVEMSPRQLY
jgi:hypothetical protein